MRTLTGDEVTQHVDRIAAEGSTIVEGGPDAGCLISSLSSTAICEGGTPQPMHSDDHRHYESVPAEVHRASVLVGLDMVWDAAALPSEGAS